MIDSTRNIILADVYDSQNTEVDKPTVQTYEISESPIEKSDSEYCVTFAERKISCCVGIVDMVGSTKLAALLGMKKMPKYYQHFLNLMSKVIIEFDGRIIKNVGDCLLFYFPITQTHTDSIELRRCLECSIAMIQVREFLCSHMKRDGLPCVSYRVSLDYGQVIPMKTSGSDTLDIIGPAVNICSKINRFAADNGVVLGSDLYERVRRLDGFALKQIGEYSAGLRFCYPVYSLGLRR